MTVFFTVGHSNHKLSTLVDLLRANSVDTVVDVRSSPYSRLHPQFNRETLDPALRRHGVRYKFFGDCLGGRSEDPACYKDGRVDYEAVAHSEQFQQGLERLIGLGQKARIALLCAEREPIECHRLLLVGRGLCDSGEDVRHIHANGVVESHGAAVRRLISLAGKQPDQVDLLLSDADVEAQAYARQAARVAYVDPHFTPSSKGALG